MIAKKMKPFMYAAAGLLLLVEVYFVCVSGECVVTAVPSSEVAASSMETTGGTHSNLRDQMLGFQLVRKGGRVMDGDGVVSRLLTRPGEVLTSFIPVRNNVVVNSPPGQIIPQTASVAQGQPSTGVTFNLVAEPAHAAVIRETPSMNRIVIKETPAASPPQQQQPVYIQLGTQPLNTPTQTTSTDNSAVVVQTVDVQTLINQLCGQYGCPPGLAAPKPTTTQKQGC